MWPSAKHCTCCDRGCAGGRLRSAGPSTPCRFAPSVYSIGQGVRCEAPSSCRCLLPPCTCTQSASDIRQRLRAEVLRWHPDKFLSRFSRALRPGAEREAALQRCKEVSQALTHMMAGRA